MSVAARSASSSSSDHGSCSSSVSASSSSSRARSFFSEHQQCRGFGERLLFPRELALERPDPLHRRQRRTPFLTQGQSPVLVFGLQYALALEQIRQLRTREGARRRQNPNLLLDRPVAPRAIRRHDWKSTRLLQPPRERLLT